MNCPAVNQLRIGGCGSKLGESSFFLKEAVITVIIGRHSWALTLRIAALGDGKVLVLTVFEVVMTIPRCAYHLPTKDTDSVSTKLTLLFSSKTRQSPLPGNRIGHQLLNSFVYRAKYHLDWLFPRRFFYRTV